MLATRPESKSAVPVEDGVDQTRIWILLASMSCMASTRYHAPVERVKLEP